jgi:hypothetical protein
MMKALATQLDLAIIAGRYQPLCSSRKILCSAACNVDGVVAWMAANVR